MSKHFEDDYLEEMQEAMRTPVQEILNLQEERTDMDKYKVPGCNDVRHIDFSDNDLYDIPESWKEESKGEFENHFTVGPDLEIHDSQYYKEK